MIEAGAVLVCITEAPVDVYVSAEKHDVLREVRPDEKVVAAGHAFEVHGCEMVPLEGGGVVEADDFDILHQAPVVKAPVKKPGLARNRYTAGRQEGEGGAGFDKRDIRTSGISVQTDLKASDILALEAAYQKIRIKASTAMAESKRFSQHAAAHAVKEVTDKYKKETWELKERVQKELKESAESRRYAEDKVVEVTAELLELKEQHAEELAAQLQQMEARHFTETQKYKSQKKRIARNHAAELNVQSSKLGALQRGDTAGQEQMKAVPTGLGCGYTRTESNMDLDTAVDSSIGCPGQVEEAPDGSSWKVTSRDRDKLVSINGMRLAEINPNELLYLLQGNGVQFKFQDAQLLAAENKSMVIRGAAQEYDSVQHAFDRARTNLVARVTASKPLATESDSELSR